MSGLIVHAHRRLPCQVALLDGLAVTVAPEPRS